MVAEQEQEKREEEPIGGRGVSERGVAYGRLFHFSFHHHCYIRTQEQDKKKNEQAKENAC